VHIQKQAFAARSGDQFGHAAGRRQGAPGGQCLATDDLTATTLRAAANRGALQATKGVDPCLLGPDVLTTPVNWTPSGS
jgi:hypothetical protein